MSGFRTSQHTDASAAAAAASACPSCAAFFRITGMDAAVAAGSIFVIAALLCGCLLSGSILPVSLPALLAGTCISPAMVRRAT